MDVQSDDVQSMFNQTMFNNHQINNHQISSDGINREEINSDEIFLLFQVEIRMKFFRISNEFELKVSSLEFNPK